MRRTGFEPEQEMLASLRVPCRVQILVSLGFQGSNPLGRLLLLADLLAADSRLASLTVRLFEALTSLAPRYARDRI